jgi:hypothetical protein
MVEVSPRANEGVNSNNSHYSQILQKPSATELEGFRQKMHSVEKGVPGSKVR